MFSISKRIPIWDGWSNAPDSVERRSAPWPQRHPRCDEQSAWKIGVSTALVPSTRVGSAGLGLQADQDMIFFVLRYGRSSCSGGNGRRPLRRRMCTSRSRNGGSECLVAIRKNRRPRSLFPLQSCLTSHNSGESPFHSLTSTSWTGTKQLESIQYWIKSNNGQVTRYVVLVEIPS